MQEAQSLPTSSYKLLRAANLVACQPDGDRRYSSAAVGGFVSDGLKYLVRRTSQYFIVQFYENLANLLRSKLRTAYTMAARAKTVCIVGKLISPRNIIHEVTKLQVPAHLVSLLPKP
jgi:hypothetical protein